MLHPPYSQIVAWPTPNFVDPVERGFARVIVTAILIPIVILAVLLRIWTRWKITKSFGVDDTLIALALIPTLAFDACIIAIDFHFYGRIHSWDVPYATDHANLKMYLASGLIFGISASLIKISLLCFYQRLLGSTGSPAFMRIIRVAFLSICSLTITSLLAILFSCVPISASFDVFPTYHYTCVSDWMRPILGILNLVADLSVLVLPVPIVWKLQMPRLQRLMVIGIFSLSVVASAAGLVKVCYSARVARSYDLGWEGYGEGMASMLELNLGIMCGSAPALKPLVKRYWPGALNTYETWEEDHQGDQSAQRRFVELSRGTRGHGFKTSTEKILEEGGDGFLELDKVGVTEVVSIGEESIGRAPSKTEF